MYSIKQSYTVCVDERDRSYILVRKTNLKNGLKGQT
jgi:hypothetical protein